MRYLVTIELIDGAFIHLRSEFSQTVCSQWKGHRSFQMRFRWVFPSLFNWDASNPLVSRWSGSFEFSFCEGKTRFTDAIAANKRANSNNFKIKKNWIYLRLISLPFTYWEEVNFRTSINGWWEWIIHSVRSLTVFEENIAVTVLTKLVSLFF